MSERKWVDIDPELGVEANLRSLWMNRTFAGPSEKLDHESEFDQWLAKTKAEGLESYAAELEAELPPAVRSFATTASYVEDQRIA